MQSLSIYIGWIGTGFGFLTFYTLCVANRKRSSLPQRLLSLLVLTFAWTMLVTTANASGLTIRFPHLFRTALPVGLLIGPFSFLYVRSLLCQRDQLTRSNWFHFIPAVLLFLDFLPFYLSSTATKRTAFQDYLADSSLVLLSVTESFISKNGVYWSIIVSLLGYAVGQSILIFRRAKRELKLKKGQISEQQLIWLTALTVFLLVLALALVWALSTDQQNINVYATFAVIYTLGFVFLSLILYQSPDLLYGLLVNKTTPTETVPKKKDYIPLSDEQIKKYCQRVNAYMRTDQPYLNPELSLSKLAEELDISRNHLSIVLNKGIGMKFNDLINRHRIVHLHRGFSEMNHEQLTIEGIAGEVGFKSRTTFMHSVKKLTGLTPSQFIDSLKKNQPLTLKTPLQ